MKKHVLDFCRRGLIACGFGPLALAIFYLVLGRRVGVETLAVQDFCKGIFSLAALAFVAGGMNAVYQIERLPLMMAILIHGAVLYCAYLVTYLLNSWLEWSMTPVLVFTGIFVVGYLAIWAVIYCIIKRNTEKINAALKKNRQKSE